MPAYAISGDRDIGLNSCPETAAAIVPSAHYPRPGCVPCRHVDRIVFEAVADGKGGPARFLSGAAAAPARRSAGPESFRRGTACISAAATTLLFRAWQDEKSFGDMSGISRISMSALT